jgi:hypothetical protein
MVRFHRFVEYTHDEERFMNKEEVPTVIEGVQNAGNRVPTGFCIKYQLVEI